MLLAVIILVVCAWYWFRREEGRIKPAAFPLSADQKRENYQSVREFLEKNPGHPIRHKLPSYVADIELPRRYAALDELLSSGALTEAEYQEELEKLLPVPDIQKRKRKIWRFR